MLINDISSTSAMIPFEPAHQVGVRAVAVGAEQGEGYVEQFGIGQWKSF
jgi:hypothetical protein